MFRYAGTSQRGTRADWFRSPYLQQRERDSYYSTSQSNRKGRWFKITQRSDSPNHRHIFLTAVATVKEITPSQAACRSTSIGPIQARTRFGSDQSSKKENDDISWTRCLEKSSSLHRAGNVPINYENEQWRNSIEKLDGLDVIEKLEKERRVSHVKLHLANNYEQAFAANQSLLLYNSVPSHLNFPWFVRARSILSVSSQRWNQSSKSTNKSARMRCNESKTSMNYESRPKELYGNRRWRLLTNWASGNKSPFMSFLPTNAGTRDCFQHCFRPLFDDRWWFTCQVRDAYEKMS